ncbi:hypothetical protein F5Y19DRAFT_478847 [Xylariaceae sp. FL1651]|nr:hypothetical protein F5Y19DRAFT_478847 [Xylariaceae sp. FL1651]
MRADSDDEDLNKYGVSNRGISAAPISNRVRVWVSFGGCLPMQLGRVAKGDRDSIPGLYAAANTFPIAVGHEHYGASTKIGPAMASTYVSVHHIAEQAADVDIS